MKKPLTLILMLILFFLFSLSVIAQQPEEVRGIGKEALQPTSRTLSLVTARLLFFAGSTEDYNCREQRECTVKADGSYYYNCFFDQIQDKCLCYSTTDPCGKCKANKPTKCSSSISAEEMYFLCSDDTCERGVEDQSPTPCVLKGKGTVGAYFSYEDCRAVISQPEPETERYCLNANCDCIKTTKCPTGTKSEFAGDINGRLECLSAKEECQPFREFYCLGVDKCVKVTATCGDKPAYSILAGCEEALNFITQQEVCGNGRCGSGENCENCPNDCGICAVFGYCLMNNICQMTKQEECSATFYSTFLECYQNTNLVPEFDCGNGYCNTGEDSDNCPVDCGYCPANLKIDKPCQEAIWLKYPDCKWNEQWCNKKCDEQPPNPNEECYVWADFPYCYYRYSDGCEGRCEWQPQKPCNKGVWDGYPNCKWDTSSCSQEGESCLYDTDCLLTQKCENGKCEDAMIPCKFPRKWIEGKCCTDLQGDGICDTIDVMKWYDWFGIFTIPLLVVVIVLLSSLYYYKKKQEGK